MVLGNVAERVEASHCCGCEACYNSCPSGAISMNEDAEGFLSPVIDKAKCTHCGLCVRVCPVLGEKYTNFPKPDCYAAKANDEVRMTSSSGGIFSVLAEHILDRGGYVCGAAFDEDWSVHHIIVNSKKSLGRLRGSKYVQSNIGTCYKEIKNLLESNKFVLFSGTPCQVAGLYSYLRKKYENLLTVDIFCIGVSSPGVWRKYLSENFDQSDIVNVNFRDKSKIGWSCTHCTITTRDGRHLVSDDYTKMFHASIIMRQSCSECRYSKLPRPGDITLGDFWGIDNYDKALNDHKGVSIVLINSDKGKVIYDSLKNNLTQKKVILSHDYNNGRIHGGLIRNHLRSMFFRSLRRLSYKKNVDMIVNNKYDICLVSMFFAPNYGSILVAYACYTLISRLGYNILVLQKPSFVWSEENYNYKISQDFAEKHYNISAIPNTIDDLPKLNESCTQFVVASDQMFQPLLHLDYAFLDWVQNNKNKVAFGTSFGQNEYLSPQGDSMVKQFLLDRFDHIALREKSKTLCSKIFKIDAVEIIDPTLILPLEEYEYLIKTVDVKVEMPYLLAYLLDVSDEKIEAINYISAKLQLSTVNIIFPAQQQAQGPDTHVINKVFSPEEFLFLYKHASFVVTDSFHGTCFAVKYNKPFVSFENVSRGALRYKLFDLLKVSKHVISDVGEVYSRPELLHNIDYSETNKIIHEKADFAIKWLTHALDAKNSIKFEQRKARKFARTRLRAFVLLPKAWLNLQRCRLASHLFFGRVGSHYATKKRRIREQMTTFRNFLRF